MKNKLNFSIEIKSIEVDGIWYTIKYIYSDGTGMWEEKEITGDHSWEKPEEWKRALEEGEALRMALSDVADNY